MKKLSSILVLFMLALLLQACSKTDNPTNSNSSNNTNNTLKGTWKLNYFGSSKDTLNAII